MDLRDISILGVREEIKKGKISCKELARFFLDHVKKVDSKVRAFLYVNEEWVLKQAEESDRRWREGRAGVLEGIPISIKDNILIKGHPTTCASKILANYIAPYDATVIERLRKEGAVFLGKTNMDEFAMGSSTENSAFHPTYNPWDLERVPGGSSGGSAVAVSTRMGLGSLGSDTGGSIRQPASFCGVVGMKPTYGLVSRFGLVAFASSLDQIGPIALNVEDTALLLKVIAGPDPRDSTSADITVPDYLTYIKENIQQRFTIGLPREYFTGDLDSGVSRLLEEAIRVLSQRHTIKEISLPHTRYAVATYYIVAPAEASSNLARYDGIRYGFRAEAKGLIDLYKKSRSLGFGKEVKRRIMLGTYALSAGYYDAYYLKASKVRTLIKEDFERAFREVDLIFAPTTPTPPFRIGEKTKDPLQMYLSDIFTIPVNLAGLPAISLPIGLTEENLPVGAQIIGPVFRDELVLTLAYQLEQALSLRLIPPIIREN